MSNSLILNIAFVEVKCPCCGRHLDKFKVVGEMAVSRKCKSCKNNIITEIKNDKIVSNEIDARENSRDIISPNRYAQKNNTTNRNPLRINKDHKLLG
jgi:hypothetical protein